MLKSIRSSAGTVAWLAVAAALAVGGVAAAQGGGEGQPEQGAPSGKRMPPPPMGPMGKDLTYAQFHVQHEGSAQVIRLDSGKIAAVDSNSITLSENDGNEVTVVIGEGTKVLAGPGRTLTTDDLEVGQRVQVCGPEGGTAKAILLPPPKGGQLLPPPQGQEQMRG
ncbi:MAG: hypothetical protein ACJ75S_09085 [Solirubrobacterales bacterium]